MARYKLPPLPTGSPEPEGISPPVRESYVYPDEWARQITIPVNQEIIDSLSVGGEAEVTLYGTISELSSNQSETGSGRSTLTIKVTEVEAETGDDEQAEAELESGMGGKRGIFGAGRDFFNKRGF